MEYDYTKEFTKESVPVTPKKSPFFSAGCMLFGCGTLLLIIVLGIILLILALLGSFVETVKNAGNHEAFSEELILREEHLTKKIAVLDISGVILNQRSAYGTISDSEDICAKLDLAENDSNVKAVILSLNTPGGEVTAADDIHSKILKLRKKKPVIALMNSIAASGGYYVAVACNKILANRMTLTGSIGVIISTYNYKGLLDKVGVESEVYKSGEMKDMLNGGRVRTPKEIAVVQNLVDESYNEFVRLVSEGRNIPEKTIKTSEIGDGRILHGSQALKLGLIDGFGRMNEAVELAEKLSGNQPGTLKVVRYHRNYTIMDYIFGAAESGSFSKIQIQLPGASLSHDLPRGRLYFLPGDLCR